MLLDSKYDVYRLFNTFKNNSQLWLWQTKAVCCFQSDLSRMTFQEKISRLGAFQTFVRRIEPVRDISFGVSVFNTFLLTQPHKPAITSLSSWKIEDVLSDDIISWRYYCDKPRSWEKGGPSPGEQNELIRCFGSQTKSKRVTCLLQRRQLRNDLPQKHKVWARLLPSGVERNNWMPAKATQTLTVQRPVKPALHQPHLPHLPCPLRVKIVHLPTKTSWFGLP